MESVFFDKPPVFDGSRFTFLGLKRSSDGKRLFSGFVPSSPGDGSVSFFGIVFEDARIASVRIKTGDSRPGPDDGKKDIVMMDDFIYGEPQQLP